MERREYLRETKIRLDFWALILKFWAHFCKSWAEILEKEIWLTCIRVENLIVTNPYFFKKNFIIKIYLKKKNKMNESIALFVAS